MSHTSSPPFGQTAPGQASGPWFRATDDQRLECELCPRACRLREGQRGHCYVRKAEAGRVVLDSYGRASGFVIDPIEKKPLNHFYPGSSVLSFGTAGCNLGCRFCQNWDISKARSHDRLMDVASPEQIVAGALDAKCRSLAYTYNDPVVFAEFAVDCAAAAREAGVKNVAVTAGYITERARPDFFRYMDAANVDLKAFTESFYSHQCKAELRPVLDTLLWLRHESDVWLEVTTLLIPGLNDSDAEVTALCEWFASHLGPRVPLHFTAFHPDYKLTDRPPTPPETLQRARAIALKTGLAYVYVGNVLDANGQSTRCPRCQHVVIEREGYTIRGWGLDAVGDCAKCGTLVEGHFEAQPGRWGARRQRLQVTS